MLVRLRGRVIGINKNHRHQKEMRIQIASDLHLESRPKQTFETLLDVAAPCLALLGDIAPINHPNLKAFLEWCSSRWKMILYIPGKTECVDEMFKPEEAVRMLKIMAAPYKNVNVMFRDSFYTDDGLIILGCPFWSFDPKESRAFRDLHKGDLEWIRSVIKQYTNPFLILTHFGPVSWVQDESGETDPNTAPIFTETELLLRAPIVTWAFGHCHNYLEYSKIWSKANGIPRSIMLVCNGLGPRKARFVQGAAITEYRKDAVLRIDPKLYGEGAPAF